MEIQHKVAIALSFIIVMLGSLLLLALPSLIQAIVLGVLAGDFCSGW